MIKSFTIDHTKLNRGIYIADIKTIGDTEIVTYDIRVCKPYSEPVLSVSCLHTVEHILADGLDKVVKEPDVRLYFGPMGCQTGFYLVIASPKCNRASAFRAMDYLVSAINNFENSDGDIPANNTRQCGNCTTLKMTREVHAVLDRIRDMATRRVVNGDTGLFDYKSPVNIKETRMYEVDFGDQRVSVKTDVLTYKDIQELAKNNTPEKFIEGCQRLTEIKAKKED